MTRVPSRSTERQVPHRKGQLGANPNLPCQLSLWEETGAPGENTRLSVER
jgi:hypothetical protein